MYAVEEEIRGLPTAERLAAKQSQSKPLLASLHTWLVEKSATLSKKFPVGRGVRLCAQSVGCAVLLLR
ncbi:IS66 family transposase [Citrobacter sp. NCU1]|uniref:IS66 family transposase n=1 Tax=Citrobacter sp. NCU1 TaxID=2026683 RepID=UPI00406D4E72